MRAPALAGSRLLVLATVLELARVAVTRLASPPAWILTPVLLGLALAAVPIAANLSWHDIGLRRWREWSTAERSYFLQVLVLANAVFPLVLAEPLRSRLAESASATWGVFVAHLFYGFYQELVYRGMLQRELVRRWGALAGVLAANALYTFGPLHAVYYRSPQEKAVPMLASIFAIGLFFGVLLRRSGNLWLPAVFHAVGNAYIAASLA